MKNTIDGNLVRAENIADQAEGMIRDGRLRLARAIAAMVELHGFAPRINHDLSVSWMVPVCVDGQPCGWERVTACSYAECRAGLGY